MSRVNSDDEVLGGATERSNIASIKPILATTEKPNESPREGAEENGTIYAASKESDQGGDSASRSLGEPLQSGATEFPYSNIRWFFVCIALYSAALLYGLDNTIVADIQSAAVQTFGEVEKLAWLGSGFPLGSIAIIMPVGRACGMFDIKWVFLSGLVMFTAGSALCGGAPSMNALIVGRVWAGAGGAAMYLGVLNILSVNTTPEKRPIYISLIGLVWGIGCVLGPVVGGGFADSSATWRWAFYLNVVIFGAFSPITFFVLKSWSADSHTRFWAKVSSIDWLGTALNAGIYVCFVLAFTFGGTRWGWGDGNTIALVVMFVVCLIAFALQQTFCIFTTVEHRLFPIDFLSRRSLVLQYIAMSACSAGMFMPIYYIPLYFTFAHGDSNIDAALRLLPFICVAVFFVMFNGFMMPRWGYYMPWFLLSGVFLIVGGAFLYSIIQIDTANSTVYGITVILAVGAGSAYQAAYSVAQAKVPPTRVAEAVGFINSAQIGAFVIALTITGAIFQNVGFHKVSLALDGLGFSADDIHTALAGAKSDVFSHVSDEIRMKVIVAIVDTISKTYAVVIVAGALNIVAASLMKRERLYLEITTGA